MVIQQYRMLGRVTGPVDQVTFSTYHLHPCSSEADHGNFHIQSRASLLLKLSKKKGLRKQIYYFFFIQGNVCEQDYVSKLHPQHIKGRVPTLGSLSKPCILHLVLCMKHFISSAPLKLLTRVLQGSRMPPVEV